MEQFEATSSIDDWTLVINGPEEDEYVGRCFGVAICSPRGAETSMSISMEQAHSLKYYLIEQLGQ